MQLIFKYPCFSTPNRPNIIIKFSLVDASESKLFLSSSFFITNALLSLLKYYTGRLRVYVVILFYQDVSLIYNRPEAQILSPSLSLALFDSEKINNK